MIQVLAEVQEIEAVGYGPFIRVAFRAREICASLAPGRFVLANLGGLLPEVLFPAQIASEVFDVLVPPGHPASALQRGARLSAIGPLGNGYRIPATTRRLLLAADAAHLPILLPLAASFSAQGMAVTLLLAADTAAQLYPLRLLPAVIEIFVLTMDGSAGQQGDMPGGFDELVRWADHICVAASPAHYPALARILRERRISTGTVLAEALVSPLMACGVGACQGCAVATMHGVRLACTDGPVFDLLDLRAQ